MPSDRVIVPRSAASAIPAALGLPAVVTGGQTAAHGPEQLEVDPLSASYRYTVSRMGPAPRIVPSLVCLLVRTTAAVLDAALLAAGAYELFAGVLADCELAAVEALLLEPQPASNAAITIDATGMVRVFGTCSPRRVRGRATHRTP